MTDKVRPHDIAIRLPDERKYIKKGLRKIAKRNRMSLNQLVIVILDRWLEDQKAGKEFTMPIK
jgi:hypothetical protein